MSPVPRPSYPMYPESFFEAEARASGVPAELAPKIAAFMRRVMDKQAIDERLNYQWIAENMGGGGGGDAHVVVAASNSTDEGKARARYVCTGTDDQDTIMTALNDGITAFLLNGVYELSAPVDMGPVSSLIGEGRGVFLQSATDCIDLFGSDITVRDMSLQPTGTFAITGTPTHSFISGIETNSYVKLGSASHINDSVVGSLWIAGTASIAYGVTIHVSLEFDPASSRCRAVSCGTDISSAVDTVVFDLDGTDNTVDSSTFYSRASVDNTGRVVRVTGTRNSFVNCTVRSSSAVLRPAYAVEIDAAAVAARVKYNDLRPGPGAWGTAPLVDLGAGSLVALND